MQIAKSSAVNTGLASEEIMWQKCMGCQEFPYPENVICCSAVCFLNIFAVKGGAADNLLLTQAFVQ